MTTPTPKTPENWTKSDWYEEWLRLATKDYHNKRDGYWICYYNKEGKLIYEYFDM